MARSIITGIDIGTYHIKVVICDTSEKNEKGFPKILSIGSAESRGLRHGYVVNIQDVVESIINDKFSNKLFNQLNTNDKLLIKTFIHIFKIDIPIDDKENKEFQTQFQIVLGEYEAGNNSTEIKTALKRYIRIALKNGLISQKEGLNYLYEL